MAKGQIKQAQAKIDKDQFEQLCMLQCSREEVAIFFGVSKESITRWCHNTYGCDFDTVFRQKRENGRISLRRAQWKKATTGKMDTTMLIWLGKQYLGQTDKVETENVERIQIINDVKPE